MTGRERYNLEADLSAYLDGELPEERARLVAQHLAESEEVRQVFDELRDVSDQLTSLPRRRAPDALATDLLAKAEQQLTSDDAGSDRRGYVISLYAHLAAAAAILAIFVVGGWRGFQMPAASEPGPAGGARLVRNAERTRGPEVVTVAKGGEDVLRVAAKAESELSPANRPALGETAGKALALKRPMEGLPSGSSQSATLGQALVQQTGDEESRQTSPAAAEDTWAMSAAVPSVNVYITPQNEQEYAQTAATLVVWEQREGGERNARETEENVQRFGFEAGSKSPTQNAYFVGVSPQFAVPRQPIEREFQIPANELNYRISQLAQNVATPTQVRYQINNLTADPNSNDILQQVAQPAPVQLRRGAQVLANMRVPVPPTDKAATDTDRSGVERMNAPATESAPAVAGKMARPAGRTGGSEAPQPKRELKAAKGRENGKSAGAARGRGAAKEQPAPKDQPAMEVAGRLAKGAPPAAAPNEAGQTQAIALARPAGARTASESPGDELAGDREPPSWSRELTDRLFGFLFDGAPVSDKALLFPRARSGGLGAAGEPVTFRVVLLPPPPLSTSAPATAPAAQAAQEDAGSGGD